MAPGRARRQVGYHSSKEKNFVRSEYDLPLVKVAALRKGGRIRYFGLPGIEARDLRSWGHLCGYIAAVEKFQDRFRSVSHMLKSQFGTIDHKAHLGDVDEIILTNVSWGQRPKPTHVSSTLLRDVGFIWDFDVVYLDYFGKFLPYDRGGRVVKNRAQALRHLFAVDRQDARQPWLLIITVESTLYGTQDRDQMREFLLNEGRSSGVESQGVIDFLLGDEVGPTEQAARLVHGTLSYIMATAASNSDVHISPKPTVLYRGSSNKPMLHFAFEIIPTELLSGSQDVLPLLRSPFLRVNYRGDNPIFELLPDQPPGQTDATLRATMDFLSEDLIDKLFQ